MQTFHCGQIVPGTAVQATYTKIFMEITGLLQKQTLELLDFALSNDLKEHKLYPMINLPKERRN